MIPFFLKRASAKSCVVCAKTEFASALGQARAPQTISLGRLRGKGYSARSMKLARAHSLAALLLLSACSKTGQVAPVTQAKASQDSKGGGKAGASGDVPDLENSPFPLTLWAAFLADRDYADPSRFSREKQLDSALSALEANAPKLFAHREGQKISLQIGKWKGSYALPTKKGIKPLSKLLVEILSDAVRELKLEGKERHELEYAALNGLLEPLDPHTTLLDPEQNASLGVRTRGHFAGIGAEIWSELRRIRIVRVLPDNPAQRAGLMDGDLLYQIDGRSTVNMAVSEAQRLLRGPEGSKVKVIVRRKKQLKTITIKRGKISIPSTRAFELPDKTGYVELLSFQEGCAEDTLKEMKAQIDAGAPSIVLDLRRNGGGLLTEAIALLDGLVAKGELISVLSRKGREVEKAKSEIKIPESVPIVVLIGQRSASASEIVAGSLSQLHRAVVVGRRSFGKGSVQQLRPSSPYGQELGLKLTIAEYRVSGDTKIQDIGVVPSLALYPMRLGDYKGVGRFFDTERFNKARESAVYERESAAPSVRAPFELRYLDRTPWDKNPIDIKDEAKRAWLDPELRIAAQLGHSLAAAKVGSDPGKQSQVISKLLTSQTKLQEKALKKALARWKVDWAPAQSRSVIDPQQLEVRAELIEVERTIPGKKGRKAKSKKFRKDLDPKSLTIGDVFTLRLTLRNNSEQELSQAFLRSKYFLPELDDYEMVLGKVPAKGKNSIDLKMQVSPGRAAHLGRLELAAFANANADKALLRHSLWLGFDAPAQPELVFNYWIVDDPKSKRVAPKRPKRIEVKGEPVFEIEGNGNGQVGVGEKVLLAFEVINVGKASATIPSIVVRNRSRNQALLEEGAAPLEALAPGERRYASIAMTVSDKAELEKTIDLQVLVGDRKSSRVVERAIHLPIESKNEGAKWKKDAKAKNLSPKRVLNLRAQPKPGALLLARLDPKQTLRRVGKMGSWTAVDLGRGRLAWVQAGEEAFDSAAGRAKPKLPALRSMVVAPGLELEIPRQSSSGQLSIRGQAFDDGALEDLVIWNVPEKRGEKARKLLYRSLGPDAKESERKSMSFATQVELVPGPQRIRVVARDSDKVETQRDYWVQHGTD